jgi:hypothetical protein
MKVRGLKLWVNKSAPLVAGALAMCASAAAFGLEDAPETVRQLSATQAHLQAYQQSVQASVAPRKANAPVLARLAGKLLSERVPGLRIELDTASPTDASQAPSAGLEERSTWHLNRRAEICFDNYRVGVQRKGLMMRYEAAF